MLTLLGSVLGFGTSFLPRVMDYFQDKADKKHELEIMTRQAEIQLDKTAIDANIREVETIHEHDGPFHRSRSHYILPAYSKWCCSW